MASLNLLFYSDFYAPRGGGIGPRRKGPFRRDFFGYRFDHNLTPLMRGIKKFLTPIIF